MNSQNSVRYRIRITFVQSNTSSNHIKQHYASYYQEKQLNLGWRVYG